MTRIIGVRFKPVGKMYYFDPLDFDIKRGDNVVVETSRGTEYGEVVAGIREIEDSAVVKPLKGVLRLATREDTERYNDNKRKEKEAFAICLEKIEKHGLDMKLVEVEYTFDGSKLLFYFTADGRVDFRELVKDLAAVFRTRIELRQIGVRDESKTLGSIGVCGRNLCCAQFLGEFVPVSIKMAKEQGLSLNPSKISGACGRLMCCLKYEQDTYEELMRSSPRQGADVLTPDGRGTVTSVALLRGKVKVRLNAGDEAAIKEYDVSGVRPFDANAPEPEDFLTSEERALQESLEDTPAEKSEKKRSRQRKKPTQKPTAEKPAEKRPAAQKPAQQKRVKDRSGHAQKPAAERRDSSAKKEKRRAAPRNKAARRRRDMQRADEFED